MIVDTTLDKELSSLMKLDYIPNDVRKVFWSLISTFIKIPKPSKSDVRCLMDAFEVVTDVTLLGITDTTKQTEAKGRIDLLKACMLIEIYRQKEGFTRTHETIKLN